MSNLFSVATAGKEGVAFFKNSERKRYLKYNPVKEEVSFGTVIKKSLLEKAKKEYQKFHGDNHNGKQYQNFYQPYFTNLQMRLFHDCMYGLTSYSQRQIVKLSQSEVKEIHQKHLAAQKLLNNWRQELTVLFINQFLISYAKGSRFVKRFVSSYDGSDEALNCDITFEELGINKQQIAEKLIEFQLLPSDFFQNANVEQAA